MSKNKRVVITGYGCMTSIGNNLEESMKGFLGRKSVFCKIKEIKNLKRLKDYPLDQFVSPISLSEADFLKYSNRFVRSRSCAFLDKSIEETLISAKISEEYLSNNSERIGVSIGSLSSNLTFLDDNIHKAVSSGYENISRLTMMNTLNNILGSVFNVKYKLKGPMIVPSTACATGLSSIGDAYNMILLDYADMFIVGASEECLNPLTISGPKRIGAMNSKSESKKICAPFDFERNGLILGEGAGSLILETLDSALRRNAPVVAEIIGYGCSSDGYHYVKPDETGEGAFRSMKMAFERSGLTSQTVKNDLFINAHATSTVPGDLAEVRAILKFKNYLKELQCSIEKIVVTAQKGNIGHCFSSAGVIESICGIESLRISKIPPICNFEKFEEDLSNVNFLTEIDDSRDWRYCLKNSFGFGGVNNSIIFKKYTN